MLTDEFDLGAYRTRIGLSMDGPPSPALLRAVIAHHAASVPFENLDIVLGRPILLDIAALQAKLVVARRGGYCFEQNTLLRAALERMGFRVTSLMGRVLRASPPDAIRPRTHLLLRVDLAEGPFLADVGSGNVMPTAPLRLDRFDTQGTEHEEYRLRALNGEMLLEIRLGEDWEPVYRFSDAVTYPIDHEVGNWFTSTKPGRMFTANVVVTRSPPGCRKTLFNGVFTIRDGANETQRSELTTVAALRDALHDHFGIELAMDDLATVHAAVRRYAERGDAGFRAD
jgi:N-hydroxyarylamine O-acetyltransferase